MKAETAPKPNRFCDAVDNVIRRIGYVLMWSNAILVAIIMVQVILRYGFGRGLVMLEELEWHFYGAAFMFGLSYAVMTDSHIRCDIVHARLSEKWRKRWDLFGYLFILLPFVILILYQSLDFVHESWRLSERSVAPTGLAFRWAIKSVIPLSFALLTLATFSRIIRIIGFLRRS
jgi:TRAP-type mannitol/chloroaromatic compound transport system permease small subunit